MAEIDNFLEEIHKNIEDYKRLYYSRQRELPQKVGFYETILESKESSKELKAFAILGKASEQADLARLAGEISLLYNFTTLAIQLKILGIAIDSIRLQLAESRILERTQADDIAKLKEEHKKAITLMGKFYEQKKKMEQEMEEKRKRYLSQYVV